MLPGGSQFNMALRTLKQLHAKVLFKRFDLLAKRWLRHIQAARRFAEVQLFGNKHEITQLAQVDGIDTHFISISIDYYISQINSYGAKFSLTPPTQGDFKMSNQFEDRMLQFRRLRREFHDGRYRAGQRDHY